MPVFLQTSINICEKIEKGEVKINAVPYTDTKTGYVISILSECDYAEWVDCAPNNQPDWFAFRPSDAPLFALYLKNKHSHLFHNRLNPMEKILKSICISCSCNEAEA